MSYHSHMEKAKIGKMINKAFSLAKKVTSYTSSCTYFGHGDTYGRVPF